MHIINNLLPVIDYMVNNHGNKKTPKHQEFKVSVGELRTPCTNTCSLPWQSMSLQKRQKRMSLMHKVMQVLIM